MSAHSFPVRVYYEDTDFSGNVYHAAYLKFFERGRTEFLRERGVHHSELAREGLAFAVRSMQIEFEAAAGIDDQLEVRTAITAASGVRLHLEQTVVREAGVLARAQVLVVAIRIGSGRPARLPQALLARLSA